MGQSNGGFVSPSALSDSTNAGVSSPIDTGAADLKTHVPGPNVGQRLGSVLMNQFPMAGAAGQGLYHQVFGQGQSPEAPSVQEGVGPPIVGVPDAQQPPQQAKGGGLGMKILKALLMG